MQGPPGSVSAAALLQSSRPGLPTQCAAFLCMQAICMCRTSISSMHKLHWSICRDGFTRCPAKGGIAASLSGSARPAGVQQVSELLGAGAAVWLTQSCLRKKAGGFRVNNKPHILSASSEGKSVRAGGRGGGRLGGAPELLSGGGCGAATGAIGAAADAAGPGPDAGASSEWRGPGVQRRSGRAHRLARPRDARARPLTLAAYPVQVAVFQPLCYDVSPGFNTGAGGDRRRPGTHV